MIVETKVKHYLERAKIPLRLACTTDSDWPIVLSLWYMYEEGVFYCATVATAIVVQHLRANPRCAFEVAADVPPYCGVRGRAIATVDEGRGMEILERLLLRYLGGVDNSLAHTLLNRSITEVAIRLEPQTSVSPNNFCRISKWMRNTLTEANFSISYPTKEVCFSTSYTWNFTERMADIVGANQDKLCPEL